jgi:hypothetical protein
MAQVVEKGNTASMIDSRNRLISITPKKKVNEQSCLLATKTQDK